MLNLFEKILFAGMVTYILYVVWRLTVLMLADRNLDRICDRVKACWEELMEKGEELKAEHLFKRVCENLAAMPDGA